MKFLRRGKVKDVYDMGDGTLLFRFSNRVSAFDVLFEDTVPRKGEVLCRFARYWFGQVPHPNHFVSVLSDDTMLVKKMQMIPMECVVRGYLYGSLAGRRKEGSSQMPLASRLPEPVFDPTTKSEHDVPVDRQTAIKDGLVGAEQYDYLQEASIRIYNKMSGIVDRAGFILADLKLEFGMLDGRVLLGDSIGPDEYRLWPKESYEPGRIQRSFDKQILRDWLVQEGWASRFEEARAAGNRPTAPRIAEEVIQEMSARYVESYERITGEQI